jgi:hypothetical protein
MCPLLQVFLRLFQVVERSMHFGLAIVLLCDKGGWETGCAN